jgi:hypothetical protein
MHLRQSMDGSSRKMLAGLDLSLECDSFSMVGNPCLIGKVRFARHSLSG